MVSATLQKNVDLASLDERLARVVEKLKHVDLPPSTAPFARSIEEDAPTLSNPSCDEEVCSRHTSASGDRNFQVPRSVNPPYVLNAYDNFFSGSAKSLPPADIDDVWSNPSSTSSLSKFKVLGINSPRGSSQWSIPNQNSPLQKSQDLDIESCPSPTYTVSEQLRRMRDAYKNKLQQLEINRRQLRVKLVDLETKKKELKRLKSHLHYKHEKHIIQDQEEKANLRHNLKQLKIEKRVLAKKSLNLEERDLQLLNKIDMVDDSCMYILDESTKERLDCRVYEEWQDYIKEKDKFNALHAAVAEQNTTLQNMRKRLDNDRRDVGQQKQLFKTTQQSYDIEKQKLSDKRSLLEEGAKKLRKIKECISKEKDKLTTRKRLMHQEVKDLKIQQEEFKKQLEDFEEERNRILELDSTVKAQLKEVAQKEMAIEGDKAKLDILSQEIEKHKQFCDDKELQNSTNESKLQQLSKDISAIIHCNQAEQEATTILKSLVMFADVARSG